MTIAVTNNLLKTVLEACKANEALTAAVKETDSKLFEMLEANNQQIKELRPAACTPCLRRS